MKSMYFSLKQPSHVVEIEDIYDQIFVRKSKA